MLGIQFRQELPAERPIGAGEVKDLAEDAAMENYDRESALVLARFPTSCQS